MGGRTTRQGVGQGRLDTVQIDRCFVVCRSVGGGFRAGDGQTARAACNIDFRPVFADGQRVFHIGGFNCNILRQGKGNVLPVALGFQVFARFQVQRVARLDCRAFIVFSRRIHTVVRVFHFCNPRRAINSIGNILHCCHVLIGSSISSICAFRFYLTFFVAIGRSAYNFKFAFGNRCTLSTDSQQIIIACFCFQLELAVSGFLNAV